MNGRPDGLRVDGSCHCGRITFEAVADPGTVRICHCRDCQQLTGSAFSVAAPVAEGTFRLLSGKPRIYIKIAENGAKREQAFCPECGSRLYATSVPGPDGGQRIFGLRVGTLAQCAALPPRRQFWRRSALDWITKINEIPATNRE